MTFDIATTFNTILEISGKVKNAELTNHILKLQAEVYELQEENHTLRDEIRGLKATTNLDSQFAFDKNVYWRLKDPAKGSQPDNYEPNPYCPGCKDGHAKAVRLRLVEGQQLAPYWRCPVCDKSITRK